ncbi:peptidoglycan D,D-transpeptidase FtsI family protein [Gryllotalpicola protaetiae]|uniref:Penicillin-binding protein 2 n=1 Tax=Gryllotalpicola protaetiae TaxID=2419771 RepID=A0A387BRY7_9MICO|nr:penicillin-binding protein 2 [Gryllotalpicola protaetiae]AYG05468.1 penicillin-binding protein 2 [Gryllotalpicola protaetiae]
MKAKKSTRRRTSIALLIVLALVASLVYKLFDIQVVHASALTAQAAERRGTAITLYGARGDIVGDDGTVLAGSVLRYDFIASPVNALSAYTDAKGQALPQGQALAKLAADPVLAKLSTITGTPVATFVADFQNALTANAKSQYAPLISNADVPTFDKIEALKIPWLTAVSHPARTYPDGAVGGNIVGYVNSAGLGSEGLEQQYQKCLVGDNGEETYQASRDGVALPGSTKVTKAAKQGGTLETTLDPDLTWFLNQNLATTVPGLGAQFGQATVVDIKTGEIKAAAQFPSVDPNNIDSVPAAYRSTAMMFSNQYEPGSIFKALTAAAMIDTGYATPASHVLTPDKFTAPHGVSFGDAEYHPTEDMTLTGILMNSSNVGIAKLSAGMSDQTRYDYYKKFGIGTPTDVPFPAQASGILTRPSQWDDQTKYTTTFGQGVSATQAQMLQAYQALANGGVMVPLSLVKGCKQSDGTLTDVPQKTQTRVVKQSTSTTVLDMLESVVQQGSNSAALKTPGYRIAAKTGTAQEPDGHGGYQSDFYISVMGVAPVDDPQYLVSVNIGFPANHRMSDAAAPLFHTVMSQVLKTYRVSPSDSAPTMLPPYYPN